MQATIDKERIESLEQKLEIDNDIKLILNSKEPLRTWCDLSKKYTDYITLYKNHNKYYVFICEAAKEGIIPSYPLAAEYYYKIVNDYDMAEKYLSHLFLHEKEKRYDDPYMIWLANIYLNKLSQKTGDIDSIIKRLNEDGFIVEKSENGKEYKIVGKGTKIKESEKESLSQKTDTLIEEENCHKTKSPSSLRQSPKSGLIVGGVSDTKKMRLGRVHKKRTDSSSTEQQKKSGLTVGGVSGSTKMRLGRVHKKKTDSSSTEQN